MADSDWCIHPLVLRRWEKGPKIRDEKDKLGNVVATWYKWYEVCGLCEMTLSFEPRTEE